VGGQVTQQLHIINALATRLDPVQADALALAPQVVSVSPDRPVTTQAAGVPGVTPQCSDRWAYWCPGALATSYIQSARLDKTWTDPNYGSTGQGIGVAVLDTGIDGNLPDFQVSQSNTASRVIASVTTNPNATTASDLYGHGTHVAGILAGNSTNLPTSDPNYNSYVGAAPNANLVSVKVSDDDGNASVLDVINGLQFVIDHQTDYNIRVVNLSLASTTAQSYMTDPLDAAVEAAWMHGITVITAAGNRGTASDAVQYAPANDPYVITVGAVDDQGTKTTGDDVTATWSSRGITQDGFAKPDVYAPGAHIVAPLAPGSDFASLCPSCVRNGSYFQISGTSMAAPVVAGLVADLLAAHPRWTPTQVKAALTYNASASKTDVRPTADGGYEVAGDLALNATNTALNSYTDKNLVPNTYIDPSTGNIDYTRAAWSRAAWSSLSSTDPLRAAWSRASWSCLGCSSAWSASSPTSAPTRAAWSAFFGDIPSN
jgi:serine protease AprX